MRFPAFNVERTRNAAQVAVALACALVFPVHAEVLAVIYPELGDPYRSVFSEIINGIEEHSRTRARSYPLAAHTDTAELHASIRNGGARAVIALGRQGIRAAAGLEPALPVVVGGISALSEAERQTGISLMPDPALLFTQLKLLVPGARRVLVVYNPASNEALIRLAREAARQQGLELVALEASDLASAARRYEAAFATSDGKRDALWLPPDPTTVDEATILPIVLRESWNRGVPIFSSNLLHVKKGALFALYPNNVELGRDLAALAQSLINGDAGRRGMLPLRAVRTALNARTASHIGLVMAPAQQQAFDAIYPER